MPLTFWEDIAGQRCEKCGRLATHWWGDMAICCDCHAGEGNGLCTQAQALEQHIRILWWWSRKGFDGDIKPIPESTTDGDQTAL